MNNRIFVVIYVVKTIAVAEIDALISENYWFYQLRFCGIGDDWLVKIKKYCRFIADVIAFFHAILRNNFEANKPMTCPFIDDAIGQKNVIEGKSHDIFLN